MTDEPSFNLVRALVLRWRALTLFAALGFAAGAIYGTLAPKWYEATLRVVQSQRSQESAATSLASKLPVGLDGVSTDVQRIRAVLVSNSVTDEVIDRFNLRDRYGVEFREHAREALWNHCATAVDKKAGVVVLTCEDKDPKIAMQMASYFGEVGNKVFRRVSASSAGEERKFLESQVEKARRDVDESSRKLREFQEQHKIVDLPEQSKAVISAMASIQGELISKQLELSYLTSFSSRTESNVLQLKQQIDIMESKLGQLESQQQLSDSAGSAGSAAAAIGSGSAGSAAANNKDFFPGAMRVPALRFELEQLLREQKMQETLFFLLTQRFEMAKVDEARDTSTFQILDYPTLPTYKSRPKRTKLAAVGLIAGLALGTILVLGPLWYRRLALR